MIHSILREFHGALAGAVIAGLTIMAITTGLGLLVYSTRLDPSQRPVEVKMDRAQVMRHPTAFVTVADKKTGRIVLRIDQDGTLHPDYRKKFKLLQRKYKRKLCGYCPGDVREGRVGH